VVVDLAVLLVLLVVFRLLMVQIQFLVQSHQLVVDMVLVLYHGHLTQMEDQEDLAVEVQ
jgi:hypothetical protein